MEGIPEEEEPQAMIQICIKLAEFCRFHCHLDQVLQEKEKK